MSKHAGEQSENDLRVLTEARSLASYTIHICCNENYFPAMYNNAITSKIVDTASNIFIQCWTANNILVGGSKEKADERLRLQRNAYKDCNTLLALIQIAHEVFHLRTKRIKYWGGKVYEVKKLIRGWTEKDKERYKNIGT